MKRKTWGRIVHAVCLLAVVVCAAQQSIQWLIAALLFAVSSSFAAEALYVTGCSDELDRVLEIEKERLAQAEEAERQIMDWVRNVARQQSTVVKQHRWGGWS